MINIIIADDNQQVRFYIHKLLSKVGDLEVVGEAQNGVEALSLVSHPGADILILDIEMPEINGIEVLKHLHQARASIKTLILSGYTDRELIRGALNLGACGYIFKEEAPVYLIPAIRSVIKGPAFWLSRQPAASWLG